MTSWNLAHSPLTCSQASAGDQLPGIPCCLAAEIVPGKLSSDIKSVSVKRQELRLCGNRMDLHCITLISLTRGNSKEEKQAARLSVEKQFSPLDTMRNRKVAIRIEKAGVSAEPEMETQVEKDELTETERDNKSLRMERSEKQEASGGVFHFKVPRKKRQRKVTADVVTKKKANYTDDGSSVSDSSQPEKSRERTPWNVSIACKDPEQSSEFDSEEEGSQTD
ncbi:UNVERIFIED_CONTAM: hypothetical protein FKN15_032449 [Acipenser sinensis]